MFDYYGPYIPSIIYSGNDTKKYKRNLMKIEVYYEEFNFEKVKEKPTYTVSLNWMYFSNNYSIIQSEMNQA